MDFGKLFETQRLLDAEIERKHPVQPGEDRLAKRILALQVELGECANEWRGFKFWSKYPFPDPARESYPLLEEYVDCLHFILSIGNEISFTAFHLIGSYEDTENITEMFLKVNEEIVMVSRAHRESAAEESMRLYYSLLFDAFITLGEMLGFTWDQIEAAYMSKNHINHERQANGY